MFHDPYDLLSRIPPDARVLDIGGAEDVFPRANAVVDAVPFANRKRQMMRELPEQFDERSWYVGDICDAAVWSQIPDKSFDFVICSHTLEDIRDPIYVCRQMVRVGNAGYIETPSRFRECAKANADDEESGWNHHRWIVDIEGDRLIFTAKMGWAHHFDYLGKTRRRLIQNRFNNYTALIWHGSFDYLERFPKGPVNEAENLFLFYETYVDRTTDPIVELRDVAHRGKTFEWSSEFLLPIERKLHPDEILERWKRRKAGLRLDPLI